MGHLLVGIEVKPALSGVLFAAQIPRDNKALHAAVSEGNQVLLERIDTERVGEIEVLPLAVRTLRTNDVLAILPEEVGSHTISGKVCVLKIPQHG